MASMFASTSSWVEVGDGIFSITGYVITESASVESVFSEIQICT